VPGRCVEWSDGCSSCTRASCPPDKPDCNSASCTTRGCYNPELHFRCLRFREN
jgi:hypothetical protein